jgi:hypothetical protein
MPASQAGRRQFDPGRPLHCVLNPEGHLDSTRDERAAKAAASLHTYHAFAADSDPGARNRAMSKGKSIGKETGRVADLISQARLGSRELRKNEAENHWYGYQVVISSKRLTKNLPISSALPRSM